MSYKRVLLYGGRGCLGSVCVKHFKNKGYWVCSVDFQENSDADENIVIEVSESSSTQERVVKNGLDTFLSGRKVDGIFCVAGGWVGGSAASHDFLENCDAMWKKCVWSSSIAAALASKYLLASGLLVLTGAHAALQATPSSYACFAVNLSPTPLKTFLRPSIVCRVSTFVLSFIRSLFWCVVAMLGYGMAKAAVHQLTKSLAGQNSGLPNGSCVLAISPATLDTPMNRKWMPNANHSSWTPTEKVAELFATWLEEANSRPKSGSIIQLITQNGITECVPV
uniref:Dihydropteridine reductase n=1 Tax=Schistosoma haematobium TaxID=6185 RepID=A0A094ZQZ6_SCHHA